MLRSTVSFLIVTYSGTFLSFNHLSNCIFLCPLLFLAIYALHNGYQLLTLSQRHPYLRGTLVFYLIKLCNHFLGFTFSFSFTEICRRLKNKRLYLTYCGTYGTHFLCMDARRHSLSISWDSLCLRRPNSPTKRYIYYHKLL